MHSTATSWPRIPVTKMNGTLRPAWRSARIGIHAGPARELVIGEHNVERKTPEVLQELRSSGDNFWLALKSRVFQLMNILLGIGH